MDRWAHKALCLHFGSLFFAHVCNTKCLKTRGKACEDDPAVAACKIVCTLCPAQPECRVWSCLLPLPEGVAGGYTRAQRVQVRRAIRRSEYSYLVSQQGGD